MQGQTYLLRIAAVIVFLMTGTVQAAQYVVEGFTLGDSISSNSPTYRTYKCQPSDEFDDTIECNRQQKKRGQIGNLVVSSNLLHARNDTTIYTTAHVAPVNLNSEIIIREIDDLNKAIGAKPANVIWESDKNKDLTWAIVTWGDVKLEQFYGYAEDLDEFPRLGALVDLLGDPKRSSEQYLPVYHLSGGPGYVYAASFNAAGVGDRHYMAVDPENLDVRYYRSKLRRLLGKDKSLAGNDYRLWSDVASATRTLALATSPEVANRQLDSVFDEMSSIKLRSHVWANLPMGTIQRLGAGQYWRHDIYGPRTKYPKIRRNIENLIAKEPHDRFIEFAHFLLGDFSGALKSNPNSPISDVLHYASGYKIMQSMLHETLKAAWNRIPPDTSSEVVRDIQFLLETYSNNPDTPGTDIAGGIVNRSLGFVNRNPALFENQPLSTILPNFPHNAAEAREQFELVSSSTSMADDAAYMIGWLELQGGDVDEALIFFTRALEVGNKHQSNKGWGNWNWRDYRWAVLKEVVRILEHLPQDQRLTTVESNRQFNQESSLWYTTARSAYQQFEYEYSIKVAQMALKRMNFPVEQLPTTTDPDRISEIIERIDPRRRYDLNFIELPYIIEASRELAAYKRELKDIKSRNPSMFSRKAQSIIIKYSMLTDRPFDANDSNKNTRPKHRDLRQALHLIDKTLLHTTGISGYDPLREWLYYRKVRILSTYAPKRISKAIAKMTSEFPSSQLLDDALAEKIFSEGIMLQNPDSAKRTFTELLKKFPKGNAVDNAFSWMVLSMQCAGRTEEARHINNEIILRFPFTRHAKYALKRKVNSSWYPGCGLYP